MHVPVRIFGLVLTKLDSLLGVTTHYLFLIILTNLILEIFTFTLLLWFSSYLSNFLSNVFQLLSLKFHLMFRPLYWISHRVSSSSCGASLQFSVTLILLFEIVEEQSQRLRYGFYCPFSVTSLTISYYWSVLATFFFINLIFSCYLCCVLLNFLEKWIFCKFLVLFLWDSRRSSLFFSDLWMFLQIFCVLPE